MKHCTKNFCYGTKWD